jgi:nitroreductase
MADTERKPTDRRAFLQAGALAAAAASLAPGLETRADESAGGPQAGGAGPAGVAGMSPIKLDAPRPDGGVPLMQALATRRSTRDLSPEGLSSRLLSEVLWAADGINRRLAPGADPRQSGSRTAPSPLARYPVDIYAFLKKGVYLYRPAEHDLVPVLSGDYRKDTGIQAFVGIAPLTLLFVADLARFQSASMPVEEQVLESHVEAGCQVQNGYLYCASEGLGATVRGSVPRERVAGLLKLGPERRIVVGQTIGYPRTR